jgi:hypothetical protein
MFILSISRAFVRRVGRAKEDDEWEVAMAREYRSSRSSRGHVGVIVVALGFAMVFQDLGERAVQGYNLLNLGAWIGFDVLRSVIPECCQAIASSLCKDQRLLEGLVRVLAAHWPLLCVLVVGA